MKTANLNYNSEINQLIELNKKLKTIFDGILKEYFKLKGINKNFKELSSEYFTNPNKRLEIMTDGIELLKNNNIKILDEYDIEEMTIYYFEIDNQIAELQEQIRNKITNYEKACKNISNKKYSKKDITSYFNCLIETYNNYLNKGFEQNFSFKSSEMRNSIHSLKTEYGRKEIDIDLSIPHDKVLHLMELTSPNQTGEFFSNLYISYSKYFPEVIEYIKNEIQKENNNELESRMYMYFLQFIAPTYVEKILFNEKKLTKGEVKVIEKCINNLKIPSNIEKMEISHKEKIKMTILETINKSFEKCINFRKMYEYKMLPEIIIDYDVKKAREVQTDDYKNRTFSGAFTPNSKENTLFLANIIKKNKNSTNGYILNEEKYKFTEEEKYIIDRIIKELNTFNIYLPLDKTGEKIEIDNDKVSFIIEDSSITIGGYDGSNSNLISYTYFIESNEIKSNLPPSIFLMSYDDVEMKYETLISESCIYEAVIRLSSIIAEKINYKYDKDIKKFNLRKALAHITNNINYAYKRIKKQKMLLDKTFYTKEASIEKLRNKFQKKKRNQLFDEKILVEIVNKQLLEKEKISRKKKKNKDDRDVKKYYDDIKKYEKYIDKEELDILIYHISSYFKKDLASIHYRESFDLPTYVDHNSKVSENPYRDDKKENQSCNKPVYVTDEAPMFSMIMKLAQHIKEEYEEKLNINTKRIDRPISMVGFGIKRKTIIDESERRTIIDKYAKTFMGKTVLQAICDLRVNGWSYKLDAIYGTDDSGREIYYNIIPLTKFSPNLKKKYSVQNIKRIENNNEKDLEPRKRR